MLNTVPFRAKVYPSGLVAHLLLLSWDGMK